MMEYAGACRQKRSSIFADPGQSLPSWDKQALIEWITGSMLLVSNDYELEIDYE